MFDELTVRKGIAEFDKKYAPLDAAVKFLTNDNKHDEVNYVFAIVRLINAIYNTQIQSVHIEAISEHIVLLEKKERLASIDKIKFYLRLMLPLYSENMVLSELLWEAWDEETQIAYTFLRI